MRLKGGIPPEKQTWLFDSITGRSLHLPMRGEYVPTIDEPSSPEFGKAMRIREQE
jgi:hypothetical protein